MFKASKPENKYIILICNFLLAFGDPTVNYTTTLKGGSPLMRTTATLFVITFSCATLVEFPHLVTGYLIAL